MVIASKNITHNVTSTIVGPYIMVPISQGGHIVPPPREFDTG